MKTTVSRWMLCLSLTGALSSPLLAAVPADLQQALDATDYTRAFQLAESHNAAMGGDPDFDYAYGLAALRSGNTENAVFAFERVVVNNPYNRDARILLIEAYLALENSEAAKHEFAQLRRISSTDMRSDKIMSFADQMGIEALEAEANTHSMVVFSVGHDTNLNVGMDEDEGEIYGGYYGDKSEIEGNFAEVSAKFGYSKPISSGYVGFLKAAGKFRVYDDVEDTNVTSLAFTAGVAKSDGDRSYNYSASIKPLWTGGNHYRTLYQLNAGFSKNINEAVDFRLGAQWSYFDENDMVDDIIDGNLADRQRLLISAGISRKSVSVSHQVMAYAGTEWADDSEGKYNARDLYGISYRLTHISAASNSKTFAQIFYQRENHKAIDPEYAGFYFTGEKQKDDLAGVTLGHDRTVAADTILFARYSYQNNDSNIYEWDYKASPEDYERHLFQIGLRRQF
ncbi:hypothetical protein BOV90_04410 [Solemya velum gill symbiont]|uniref:tetratricopeptide repeat protein n=2 Tax=Solemya velum gill symbiont TaxID=2340 RepID=UPI0009965F91|nr:tetratricopeptide repeat protein [Solemya velum gill symbiont]OOY38659.1 hypothetical protein BOV89_00035 [Solemya velum gill symbiont]OOY40324.1 hypothetical protein BOV90_04410 [Solemya velum gill symbiont]